MDPARRGHRALETENGDDPDAMNGQIDRLRLLHAETGQIIDRLQTDIDRLSAASRLSLQATLSSNGFRSGWIRARLA